MKQYLTFRVAEETYGIDVLSVQEVLETIQITRVPQAPTLLLGVFNLRGSVLPAVDLGARLGTPAASESSATVVTELAVGNDLMPAGLLVDEVFQVVDVEERDILPPPTIGAASGADFVSGVVQKPAEDDFIILLDTGKLVEREMIEGAR